MAKSSSINLFTKIGVLLAFMCLTILSILLYNNTRKTPQFNNATEQSIAGTKNGASNDIFSREASGQWDSYINTIYNYSLKYPELLVKREHVDEGGYLHFVRFEENRYSSSKGVGVGVSSSGLGVESVKIKQEMMKSGGELVSEEEFLFLGRNSVRLEFEPQEGVAGEKRTVVIFGHKDLTYSISTVPEQIDRVLEGFKFTN